MSVDTVRFDATRASIEVRGELDLGTSAPLWAVLDCHLASGRRFLRLDLSGVSFIDATALNGIIRTHHALLARHGTLVLTGARGLVARVLRLTGLDDVLFVGHADDVFSGGNTADTAPVDVADADADEPDVSEWVRFSG